MKKILFIVTSAKKLGKKKTGVWFEELSTPYYILTEKGCQIDIASPLGKKTSFDPTSLADENVTESVKKFQKDIFAMKKIDNPKLLSQLDLNDYDAVFFPGGHGAMVDLPLDEFIKANLGKYFETGKVVAAVCHGPAGLVSAKTFYGTSILSGKKVTGFTNSEEVAVGGEKQVPFMLESRMKENGGDFVCGKDFAEFAIRDGNLITGQNPASSKKCAELILEALGPTDNS